MEEIISLVVANGIFAVLFCGLLVYELKDSRSRERKYTATIRALSERLDVVKSVKTDTSEIKSDIADVASDTKRIRSDTDTVKRAVTVSGKRSAGANV